MSNTERELAVQRNRLLGWSLACDEIFPGLDLGRDLRLVAGTNGLDFARVEGMDALGQSLSIALTTLLGSDVFNTQFGFDGLNALVEETNPIMVRERVRISVIQVLRKEPRIRRIIDVKLIDNRLEQFGGAESPTAGAVATVGTDNRLRRLDVRVGFETVTGDQAAVDLGKVKGSGR